jgi:hypothetical protein
VILKVLEDYAMDAVRKEDIIRNRSDGHGTKSEDEIAIEAMMLGINAELERSYKEGKALYYEPQGRMNSEIRAEIIRIYVEAGWKVRYDGDQKEGYFFIFD